YLGAFLPVVVIIWGRMIFQSLIVLPLALRVHGLASLRLVLTPLHALRSVLLLVPTLFFLEAIQRIPIADAVAIGFNYPILVTALSPFFLKEKVGPRRWIAVFTGMLGGLIILRPGLQPLSTGALLALGSGIVFAFHLILTRKLSASTPASLTVGFTSVFNLLILSAAMPFFPLPNTLHLWLWLGFASLLAIAGTYLMVRAYDFAPASVLAPFGYSEILFASMVSYVIFGNFPDLWTWVGVLVLVSSGIYISWREHKGIPERG
ncbi:MAG TPA: DMT family transporter, partial [Rhizobiales bacterium]|nr:DMT family transporter [Hyphomicrobiales bacterium]